MICERDQWFELEPKWLGRDANILRETSSFTAGIAARNAKQRGLGVETGVRVLATIKRSGRFSVCLRRPSYGGGAMALAPCASFFG